MLKPNQNNLSELLDLAKIDETKLLEMLLSALGHEEKSIVIGASLMLGRLRNVIAEPFLIRAFLTKDQEIGAAVAWALGQCRSLMAVPFLSKAIEKGFAVANSCEALGNIGKHEALPVLLGALNYNAEDVRMCAIKAIGCLAEQIAPIEKEKILQNLHPLCGDPSRKIRLCAGIVCNRISQTEL